MRNIFLLAALITLNANAALLNDGQLLWDTCEFTEGTQDPAKEKTMLTFEAVCTGLFTTTSLPTVLIDDANIEQGQIESQILIDEANGETSFLSEQIAAKFNIEISEVKEVVQEMLADGIVPTVKNVNELLN